MVGGTSHEIHFISQDDQKTMNYFCHTWHSSESNGPSFTSGEFKKFMQANGIRHITSAPYHPSTNGLAERAVQTVKHGLRKMEGESVEEKIIKIFAEYRTPHSTTGVVEDSPRLDSARSSREGREPSMETEAVS